MVAVPTNRELRNPAEGPPVGSPTRGTTLIPGDSMPADWSARTYVNNFAIGLVDTEVGDVIEFINPQEPYRYFVHASVPVKTDTTDVSPSITLKLQSRVTDSSGVVASWVNEAQTSVTLGLSDANPVRVEVNLGQRQGSTLGLASGGGDQKLEFKAVIQSSGNEEFVITNGSGGCLWGVASL